MFTLQVEDDQSHIIIALQCGILDSVLEVPQKSHQKVKPPFPFQCTFSLASKSFYFFVGGKKGNCHEMERRIQVDPPGRSQKVLIIFTHGVRCNVNFVY